MIERGGERRPAAERWWSQRPGDSIEVREGTAWALTFDDEEDADAERRASWSRWWTEVTACCATLTRRRRDWPRREIPLPWIGEAGRARRKETAA